MFISLLSSFLIFRVGASSPFSPLPHPLCRIHHLPHTPIPSSLSGMPVSHSQLRSQSLRPRRCRSTTAEIASSSPSPSVETAAATDATATLTSADVAHHGKSPSISPVNGRFSMQNNQSPGVTIVNGAPGAQGDHSRKPSVTISSAGTSGFIPNGGPSGAGPHRTNSIQFGSLDQQGSPSMLHAQPQSGLAGNQSVNPRISSPSNSPSPIPQPASSGGRPPSTYHAQGNAPNFGSFGESGDAVSDNDDEHKNDKKAETDDVVPFSACVPSFWSADNANHRLQRQMRPNQMPINAGPQATHLRRESSQSAHSDMSGHIPAGPGGPNRPGYQGGGGRGRGYSQSGYQNQMPYSPGPNYRNTPNQPRGGPNMGPQFHNQGRPLAPPFPNSPHQRSPAMANAHPVTPQMNQVPMAHPQMPQYGYNQHMPPQPVRTPSTAFFPRPRWYPKSAQKPAARQKKPHNTRGSSNSAPPPASTVNTTAPLNTAPESGQFEQYLMVVKQQNYPHAAYDHSYGYYQGYGMQQNMYMTPPSPQPRHGIPYNPQAPYVQNQYGTQPPPQSTPLSRTPSQVSNDRPGSSLGHVPPPAGGPPTSAPGHAHTASQPSNTSPAPQKNFVLPTKKSAVVIKDPKSGAVKSFDKQPPSPARATPSPVKGSAPTPPPGSDKTESKPTKTDEEKKKELQEAVRQKIEQDEAEERRKEEEARKAMENLSLKETPQESKESAQPAPESEKQSSEPTKSAEEAAQTPEKLAEKAVEEPVEKSAEELAEKPAEEPEPEKPAEPAKPAEPEQAAEPKQEEPKSAEPEKPAETKPGPPPLKEEEIDYEAIERELAEIEAKEREAEEAYYRKKQAEKEEQERREREEREAYERNMKQAELEAEAREAERLKKLESSQEDEATKEENLKLFASLRKGTGWRPSAPPSEQPPPSESKEETPTSDMGPPAKPAGGKQKPGPLKLETSKPVEPPQPSAALKSLHSARFLDDLSRVQYPPSIVSPNPALNANAPADRKFKYNKEFLLQFQNVFKEKPTLDWDIRVRETVGEPSDSGRPQSARTLGAGGRSSSGRPGIPQPFTMGQWQGTATVGAGARDRFPTSGGGATPSTTGGRPTSMGANPFATFGRPGSMGPGSLGRTGSSASLHGGMPQSPRPGSSRTGTRTSSKRDKQAAKKEEEASKAMPLTAGQPVKPLTTSATGWKPRSVGQVAATTGPDGHMPPDMVQRKVKAALNKMTPENFDRISAQILEIASQSKDETDGRTLRQVIQLTFEKATDEGHWASMYAKFCKKMLESMSPEIRDENVKDKNGNVVTGGALFRKYLLNRCQEEFERGWKVNLPPKPEGSTDQAAMMSDEYYAAAAAKRRGLGLVKFIGELYKLGMLTERIMHECVKKLVDYEGVPEEAEVESLSNLLRTIGASLDASEKGHAMMNAYFQRIGQMIETPGLQSRLKFMLMVCFCLARQSIID